MSTVQIFLRTGRMFFENSAYNIKRSPVIRCPTFSNYRNIYSTLIRKKEEAATSEKAAPSTEDITSPSHQQTQIDDLLKALEEMKHNRDELNDKYKRALAENENIRKRLLKQVEEAKVFGIQGFCKDLLEVADVLNKATESVPKEEVTDSNPHLKNLYEGLTMTEMILKKVFNRHGLTTINPLDEKFDPNFHEALFEQEVQGKPPGTVVVVSKTGYKLQERVIRPALVGVSK